MITGISKHARECLFKNNKFEKSLKQWQIRMNYLFEVRLSVLYLDDLFYDTLPASRLTEFLRARCAELHAQQALTVFL